MFDISSYLQTAQQFIANGPAIPPNATLTFTQVKSSGTVTLTFDAFGNPEIPETSTEVVAIECWLKQVKPPQNEVQTGRNINDEYFAGELVNPKVYALPILPNGTISVVINGRVGTFTPVELLDSPSATGSGYAINAYAGQKIGGLIQFQEGD